MKERTWSATMLPNIYMYGIQNIACLHPGAASLVHSGAMCPYIVPLLFCTVV